METKAALSALGALAQESRLRIFRYLVEAGPQGAIVGTIAESLGFASATLSFHLKELTHAGLLEAAQEGRFIRYTANFDTMSALVGYLTENCCSGNPQQCAPACAPKATQSPRKRVSA